MIKYTLKCKHGHAFESWFQSAEAFDRLSSAGHISCVECGSTEVEKSVMAPQVRPGRAVEARTKALQAMRAHVEENSDYVGGDFATEARAMHLGDAPERSIWGEANATEAKALIDDGVPVLPLPFTPKSKAN